LRAARNFLRARAQPGYEGRRSQRARLSHRRVAPQRQEDIDLIFYLHEQGLGTRTIAAKFDDDKTISRTTVRNVLKGRKHGQIPFAYKRVP
jgi:DNA invertase Pin-like site-specific DNA recombinase